MLEVPGVDSGPMADALANRLQELWPVEDVKVSRPTKLGYIRVWGLDDSTSIEEVVEAVARVGRCPREALKPGKARGDPTWSVVVGCPVAAAKTVAREGRFLVGWTSARAKLLPPRPRQCFRCLEIGHVREHCTAAVDRSGQCYRCGEEGHKAGTCEARPHCTICASSGKPAGHRVSSLACQAETKGRPSQRRGH